MKGINTPGQALDPGGFASFSAPQGAVYLTSRFRHSLGNGTMVTVPLLSLRWGIKAGKKLGKIWRKPVDNFRCLWMPVENCGHNVDKPPDFSTGCQFLEDHRIKIYCRFPQYT